MLQEQTIPVNFGGGTDTKTDPKAVVAGKFLRLENGVFTNPNRIAKRNGYTALTTAIAGGGNLSAPSLVHGYNNELICADSGSLYSYSPSQTAWFSRGGYVSTELTKNTVDQSRLSSGFVDCAVLGNYILYGWTTAYQQNTSYPIVKASTLISVVDSQTGTTVFGPSVLSTQTNAVSSSARCILLGGTTLAILYPNPGRTQISIQTVVFSGGGSISLSAATSATTNYSGGAYDIVTTATGAAIIYQSTTGVTVSTLDTTGAVTHTSNTIDAASLSVVVSISVDPTNGNIWAYWIDSTYVAGNRTAGSIVYKVYSSVLGAVLAKTTLVTLATPYYVSNMTAVVNSTTQQTLYYGILGSSAASAYADVTYSVTATSGGVAGTPALFAYGLSPASHSFSVSSKDYAAFIYRGPSLGLATTLTLNQPTYFILRISSIPSSGIPLAVARFGYGLVNNQCVLGGAYGQEGAMIGYTPVISAISATKFIFACGLETQEFNSDFFVSSADVTPTNLIGSFSYFIDFNSANSYSAVNSGDLAVLNGGVVQNYDGNVCSEFGFHLFPEISELTQAAVVGGNIVNGTYSYLAIFQWTDAQGNLHQSAPSIPKAITTTGTNNVVNITVTSSYLSQKPGVSVAIYRTVGSGTVYFLVTDPVFLSSASPLAAQSVTFQDILADTSIAGNPQAYAYPASPVLENSTPPPAMILLAHNNRLWLVDSENPNTEWYTKSFQDGVGVSPSAFMTQTLDPKFGNISSLSEMDDKLVSAKQLGFFIQSGDGVGDTGSGSTLSFPQIVPSDVGVSDMKSVILTPKGIMFKSPNGIYMLDRALNVSYVGAEVESYNSQTITSASLVPGKSQIRFLCSSGLTLVYDYIFNQWSTFTNHTGLSSSTWNNSYVYSTGSAIFQESASSYADNGVAYSLLAQTSWLALAGIQGFQRVKRIIMLGDYANGNSTSHVLSVAAAYDFSTTFQPAIPSPPFGATSSSGVFKYRERLPIQKCSTISLLIQETTTGSTLEYIDLTNISFEAGIKKGLNKLGGLQSVG